MAKKWTDEERKAFGDKMRAARRAKNVTEVTSPPELPTEAPEEATEESKTTYSDADISELIRQVEELKREKTLSQPQPSIQQNNTGRLIGTFEKYSIDSSKYPSPVDRLSAEPKLQRFAFPLNYELVFKVDPTRYTTIDGIYTAEPRFTLQLIKIVMDEETYEPTNKRYMLYQMIFHEDPQAAVITANEHGLEIDENNEVQFLNEMRYLRMRDWLLGLDPFYPQKAQTKKNRREEVIGNRLVEVYEVSSEQAQAIPFSDIKKG